MFGSKLLKKIKIFKHLEVILIYLANFRKLNLTTFEK